MSDEYEPKHSNSLSLIPREAEHSEETMRGSDLMDLVGDNPQAYAIWMKGKLKEIKTLNKQQDQKIESLHAKQKKNQEKVEEKQAQLETRLQELEGKHRFVKGVLWAIGIGWAVFTFAFPYVWAIIKAAMK